MNVRDKTHPTADHLGLLHLVVSYQRMLDQMIAPAKWKRNISTHYLWFKFEAEAYDVGTFCLLAIFWQIYIKRLPAQDFKLSREEQPSQSFLYSQCLSELVKVGGTYMKGRSWCSHSSVFNSLNCLLFSLLKFSALFLSPYLPVLSSSSSLVAQIDYHQYFNISKKCSLVMCY